LRRWAWRRLSHADATALLRALNLRLAALGGLKQVFPKVAAGFGSKNLLNKGS
jgi:hypothetical protein